MVESSSTLPKYTKRCRCFEGRGNELTSSVLTRRRRHKTVHFGDLSSSISGKLEMYCNEIPNCCNLSYLCSSSDNINKQCNNYCPFCSSLTSKLDKGKVKDNETYTGCKTNF